MTEMKQYLIKRWDENNERSLEIVSYSELMAILDEEGSRTNTKRQKLAVLEIGDYVIDWS